MASYLYRMPAGIPGDITRTGVSMLAVEPQIITPANFVSGGAPTAFGVPLVVDATAGNVGNMRTVVAADTAASVYGILVRPYPAGASQDPVGVSTPPASGPISVLRVGYCSVLLSGAVAAAKGGPVYVWKAAASGTHIVGGWEAADPTTSGFAIPNTVFTGPADANSITEIAFRV